jgi:hypothetical protein
VARSCTLSATTVSAGGTLTASAQLINNDTTSVSLANVVAAGRPPGAINAGGPYADFKPGASAVTIGPGQTYTLNASRTFTSSDPLGTTWRCYLTYEMNDGVWHDDSVNAYFAVTAKAGPGHGGGRNHERQRRY